MAKTWTEENASQEKLNAWIHGLGFLLSVPALLFLASLSIRREPGLLAACIVYGCSLSAMY